MASRGERIIYRAVAVSAASVGGALLWGEVGHAQEAPPTDDTLAVAEQRPAPVVSTVVPGPTAVPIDSRAVLSAATSALDVRSPRLNGSTNSEVAQETVVATPVPQVSNTPVRSTVVSTEVAGVASAPEVAAPRVAVAVIGNVEQPAMDTVTVGTGGEQHSGLAGVAVNPAVQVTTVRMESPDVAASPETTSTGALVSSVQAQPAANTPAPSMLDRLDSALDSASGVAYEVVTGRPAAVRSGTSEGANNNNVVPSTVVGNAAPAVPVAEPISIHDQEESAGAAGGTINVFGDAPVTISPDGTVIVNQAETAPATAVPSTPVITTGTEAAPVPSAPAANTDISPAISPDPERVTLANTMADSFQGGQTPSADALLAHVQANAPKAAPEGYVFMPNPGMADKNRTEYQVSNGTRRFEQRGNPELITVALAVTNMANQLMDGTAYTVEIGDLDSDDHQEHQYNMPAIDIRSRTSTAESGANDGPVFVANSPNHDPQMELELIKFLRQLTINGKPAVRYVIGSSAETEALVAATEGMWRSESRLFYLGPRLSEKHYTDHPDHLHIAINPEVIASLPSAQDPSTCGDLCDEDPGFRTHDSVVEASRNWINVSESLAPAPVAALAAPAEAAPVTVSGPMGFTIPIATVAGTEAVGAAVADGGQSATFRGFTIAQILQAPHLRADDDTGPMAQLVRDMSRYATARPRATVLETPNYDRPGETTPVPSAPATAPAPAVASAEVSGSNHLGMPDAAFALMTPDVQNFQVRDPQTSVERSRQVAWAEGGLSVEEALGPSIGPDNAYVMERFSGKNPIEAALFTGIGGRETQWRPGSSGDFKPDRRGLVAFSYGMHAIRDLGDDPIRDPVANLNPWLNTLNAEEMYRQSGLQPWEATMIDEITPEAIFQAIRLPERNMRDRAEFDLNMRQRAQEAYEAYVRMEPIVAAALAGQGGLAA